MQDNIPDALIAAFERHYDCSWDTPALRNERLAWRAAWAEATKPCLHQIQEPAPVQLAQPAMTAALFAARGALQHLREGGKPTESLLNEAIAAIDSVAMPEAAPQTRFCPECGHVGEVGAGHRDCCPDGSAAFMVPEKHAHDLRAGFIARLSAAPAAVAVPDERWCPDVCPITGRKFFMWIEHWKTGRYVPTYGGPYDSYTIPVKDEDGTFSCERFDHDAGEWMTEGMGWCSLGLMLADDQAFVVQPENPRYDEIRDFAEGRAALAATPADHIADAGKMVAAPAGWKLVPVQVPDSAFPWVSGGYSTDYRAHDPRDQKIIEDRAQRTWEAILDGIAAAPAAVPDEMRDKVTLALGLSLPQKGAPSFAWSYLLDSIRELVKCEEELVLLKVGQEMATPAAAAPVVLPEPAGTVIDAEDVEWNHSSPPKGTKLYTEQQVRALLAAAPLQPVEGPTKDQATWCSYIAGMIGCYLKEPDDSPRVKAIEGIIARRLWALPSAATATGLPAQAVEPSDAELIALNAGECFFSESPSKYPELGHGTQYHGGAPGVIGFARAALALRTDPAAYSQKFQQRVQPWMMTCFGPEISADRRERNHRFLEEALELVQSCGCTASEAHQLVDYVYGRPWGEPAQEAGGVMVTLAALCLANGLDMQACGETELARIWTKVEAIRAKQAAKPKHSPLPEHAPQAQADARDALAWLEEFTCDLRCVSTSEDDYVWNVIEHHMAEPRERVIGWGQTAIAAVREAQAAQQGGTDGSQ